MADQVKIAGGPPMSIGIVGGGIIGLSCALHLQRAGHKIHIYDRRGPGEGATAGNAGTIAISEVLPFSRPATLRHVPHMLLDPTGPLVVRPEYLLRIFPWLLRFVAACRASEVQRISTALGSLLLSSVADWRDIVRGSEGEALLLSPGRFKLYRSAEGLSRARADLPRIRELGVRVEEVDGGQLCEMEPALQPIFAGALYYPDVCHTTSPLDMTRALARHFAQDGGQIDRRHIVSIAVTDGVPGIIDEIGNSTTHDWVVIAAGAWSRPLVRGLGSDVPLDTERGYHVMMASPPVPLRRPVTVTDPGYSLAQMTNGMRLTSGVEFAGLNAEPDFRRVRRMAAHSASVVRGLDSAPVSEWLGFRPSMPTSLPLIGPLRRNPRVVLAFGHGHLGLTLGPTTGRLVADLVGNKPPSIDLSPFLPA